MNKAEAITLLKPLEPRLRTNREQGAFVEHKVALARMSMHAGRGYGDGEVEVDFANRRALPIRSESSLDV